jgi:hypothetical protein
MHLLLKLVVWKTCRALIRSRHTLVLENLALRQQLATLAPVVVLDWTRLTASSGSHCGPYGRSGPRRSHSSNRPPSSRTDDRIAPIGAAFPASQAAHAPTLNFAISSVAW